MMPKLSTHALDLAIGQPAEGLRLCLYRRATAALSELLIETRTNADGRTDEPLLLGSALTPGIYEIVFDVGNYYAQQKRGRLSSPPFLDEVPIRFSIAEAASSYHVPLLFSPWAYSTYRGS